MTHIDDCSFQPEDRRKLNKVYEDVYEGASKNDPSIITRLDRVEQVVETMTENSKQIKWALYAGLFLLVVNLLSSHIKF